MLYAGSSFSDVYTAERADIVFFGSHGPVSRGWTVFPECQAAVYADDEAEKAPGSGLEYRIPDGKPLILRIKK